MKAATQDLYDMAKVLPVLKGLRQSVPFFGTIRTKRNYSEMTRLMNALLDEVGEDEDHPLASILDVVSTLIAQYEESMEPLNGSATPRQVLKYLMEEHGLTQSDLKPQLGGQGIASEILSGRREINAKQARKLAERFSVSAALFI